MFPPAQLVSQVRHREITLSFSLTLISFVDSSSCCLTVFLPQCQPLQSIKAFKAFANAGPDSLLPCCNIQSPAHGCTTLIVHCVRKIVSIRSHPPPHICVCVFVNCVFALLQHTLQYVTEITENLKGWDEVNHTLK